ncbi:MAG: glycosyltransferase family 2 protein [Bryobacterales bacterium]|nr:glycosyltransferase family 2 protein [Bryobacterales bacterium]
MSIGQTVSLTVVTYNSRRFIGRCLESVLCQEGPPAEVIVVDNASTDGTQNVLARFDGRIRTIHNSRNLGFAAAQNQAITASRGEWVLTLNPDVLLLPGFIQRLVEAGRADSRTGSVCGKLLSIGPDFVLPEERRIDSTGIYFTPAMRHLDRGWHQRDNGHFERAEYVFGACAAAALYRREMIADISHRDGFFDPDFFVYREDADVAWRAQLLGWRCLYTPDALAYHVRSVVPGNRLAVPPAINMHSVKNRFLMRIKNATGGLYRRYWLPMTLRDLAVVGCCFLWEPTSLPAFWHLARCLRRTLEKRREIMRRRKVDDETLAAWFKSEPFSLPAPDFVLR